MNPKKEVEQKKHAKNILLLFEKLHQAKIKQFRKGKVPEELEFFLYLEKQKMQHKNETKALLNVYKINGRKSEKQFLQETQILQELYDTTSATQKELLEKAESLIEPIGLKPMQATKEYKKMFGISLQRSNMQKLLDLMVKQKLLVKERYFRSEPEKYWLKTA